MESIPEKLEALLRLLAADGLEEDKNSKRVRHSSGQVMRLLLDAKRTEQGYRGAEVLVGPSRTEQAYVAAEVALQGDKMKRERDHQGKMARASNAIFFAELGRLRQRRGPALDDVRQAMKELRLAASDPFEEASNKDFFDGLRLEYLYELLRHFRPDLDSLSKKERIALLARAIDYVNAYLEALQRLAAFLQYGKVGAYEGLATKQVTRASQQVKAAELRDLMKTEQGAPLPYNKIGKLLGEKPAPKQSPRSYDRRIERMVEAGRDILKQALGEQGYQDYIEAKRAEIEQWRTLSEDEQAAIHMQENFGIGPGDGYVIVDPREILDART
jgi:hypothetical protein